MNKDQIYIYSKNPSSGGPATWENLQQYKIVTDFDNVEDDSKIYVNNCIDELFYKSMKDFTNRLNFYFVIHSDLCPVNKFFDDYKEYFTGIICTNKFVYQKFSKIYDNHEMICLFNECHKFSKIYGKHNTLDLFTTKSLDFAGNTLDLFTTKSLDFAVNTLDLLASNANTSKTELILGYVGRLSPEKNIPMLIDAVKELNVKLLIYGSAQNNEYEVYLKGLTKNIKNIIFMGHEDDINKIYSSINIIILPSVHEGLPYCLLEARSYNVHIIANNFSKLELHIDCKNYFKFFGLNYDEYEKITYIKSYDELLKKIGYIEYVVTRRIAHSVFDTIKDLICKNGKILYGMRVVVPDHRQDSLYQSNVNLLKKFILNVINDGQSHTM